jgi:hypothetical protein
MKPSIAKRIYALERSIGSQERETVVILDSYEVSDEERADKIARWRAGENFPGMPSDVRDRENADVRTIVLVPLEPRRKSKP